MRLIVDSELCEGSGTCVANWPHIFEFDPQEKARPIPMDAAEIDPAEIKAMIESCPFEAIRCE